MTSPSRGELHLHPNEDELASIPARVRRVRWRGGFGTFPLPDPGVGTPADDGPTVPGGREATTLLYRRVPARLGPPARTVPGRRRSASTTYRSWTRTRCSAGSSRPSPGHPRRTTRGSSPSPRSTGRRSMTTSVLNTNTVTMPSKKYDSDQGFGELITDLVSSPGRRCSSTTRRPAGRCLHYHQFTEGHTCGLRSTTTATQNGVTVFAPDLSQSFTRTSVDLRNVIRGRDQAGRIAFVSDDDSVVAHNATGCTTRPPSTSRRPGRPTSNVKAAAYLASSKNDYDTRSVAIGPLERRRWRSSGWATSSPWTRRCWR